MGLVLTPEVHLNMEPKPSISLLERNAETPLGLLITPYCLYISSTFELLLQRTSDFCGSQFMGLYCVLRGTEYIVV